MKLNTAVYELPFVPGIENFRSPGLPWEPKEHERLAKSLKQSIFLGSPNSYLSMPNSNDPKKFGFLLERTFRITKLSFIKAFNKLGVDITPDQWVLVDTLNSRGELSQKELSELSFKDAATISRIIDKLVNKGFVTKSSEETDRRKTTIKLTRSGKNLVKKCQSEIDNLRQHSWQGLTEEDYSNFPTYCKPGIRQFRELYLTRLPFVYLNCSAFSSYLS